MPPDEFFKEVVALFDDLSKLSTISFQWATTEQKMATISDLKERLDFVLSAGITAPVPAQMLEEIEKRRLKAEHALSEEQSGYLPALRPLEEKFSQFPARLATIHVRAVEFSTARSGLLQREKDAFDNAAKTAAQLAEDIKSLKEPERAQIVEVLRGALGPELSAKFSAASKPVRPISSVKLPTKPLEKWEGDKRRGRPSKTDERETVTEFVRRVYGSLFEHGFTREVLRVIDPALAEALRTYERRHPEFLLSDFPSVPMGTRTNELIDELTSILSEDELRRVGMTLNSRYHRKQPATTRRLKK